MKQKHKVNCHGYILRAYNALKYDPLHIETPYGGFTGTSPIVARRTMINVLKKGLAIEADNPEPLMYQARAMFETGGKVRSIPIIDSSYADVLKGLAEEATFYRKFFPKINPEQKPIDKLITNRNILELFKTAALEAGIPENLSILAEDATFLLDGMVERMQVLKKKTDDYLRGNIQI